TTGRKTMIMNRLLEDANTPITSTTQFASIKANDGLLSPVGNRLANVTLRFNQYTKFATGDENILYIFNNTLGSTNQASQHCSGHVLFVNKGITVDSKSNLIFGSTNNTYT